MPTAVRKRSRFRLSARLIVFGLWTVLFGLLVLLFSLQLFASLSSFSSVGAFGQQSGTGIDGLLYDSLLLLYRGGFLTLGVGGALMAFGSLFVIGASR